MSDRTGRSKESLRADLLQAAPLVGLGLLFEAGLVALVWLSFRIPDTFNNIYAYTPRTRHFFAAAWQTPLPAALDPAAFQGLFAGLLAALYALWLAAFLAARRIAGEPGEAQPTLSGDPAAPAQTPSRRTFLLPGFVLGLTLVHQATIAVAMPPVFSTDVYNYIAYGRMVAFYGMNPFITLPAQMAGDPILGFHIWNIVSHNGPVWVGLGTAIAWLTGWDGLFAAALLWKGVGALAHMAIAFLGYRLARGWGQPAAVATAIFLGWNPLLLLEGAGSAHNDLFMMALALAGLLAYQRRRPWLGYILLLLSFMVKFVTILLLAFYLLAWLREQEGGRPRRRLLAAAAAVGLLVVGLAYAPFWQRPDVLLARMAEETMRFVLSPAAFLRGPLQALWAGSGMSAAQAHEAALLTLNLLQKAGLLLLLLWGARRVWVGDAPPLQRVTAVWGVVSLVYICLLHTAIVPWYFVWNLAVVGAEWFRPAQRWVVRLSTALGGLAALLYGVPF